MLGNNSYARFINARQRHFTPSKSSSQMFGTRYTVGHNRPDNRSNANNRYLTGRGW